MPAPVPNAAATLVLPFALCRTFRQTRTYPVLVNLYANGESIREIEATNSRRNWDLAMRLTPTQMTAMRDFFDSVRGGLIPFFFYDPFESTPYFNYDATGASLNGRFTVVFTTPWQQSMGLGRGDASFSLIEMSALLSDSDVLSFQHSNSSGHLVTLGL